MKTDMRSMFVMISISHLHVKVDYTNIESPLRSTKYFSHRVFLLHLVFNRNVEKILLKHRQFAIHQLRAINQILLTE